jgi:hypothetical protein
MRALHSWLGTLVGVALSSFPASAAAQAVGSEFQVNTYTTSYQKASPIGTAIAADANGNFVVVWMSYQQDGDHYGVFAQRYDSAGETLGSEFRINSFTTHAQRFPSVASESSGNFVVIWESDPGDGSGYGIFGQRYDSAGEPLGGEFRANSYTTLDQFAPSIASDAGGNFVVVWSNYDQDGDQFGVFGQRYDSSGMTQGSEFRVNTFTTGNQFFPSVAADASGNFVVVWSSYGQYGGNYSVVGQRYDSMGGQLGSEFRVNSSPASFRQAVSSDASGNFVVVWPAQDGSWGGIFGQRYDSAGIAQGGEFRVNSYTTDFQASPSVAHDASGSFVVVWQSYGQDGSFYGVFGQRYDKTGVARGGEFPINSFTTSVQSEPSVGTSGDGQFVVVWTSGSQDGSSWGVFGQRFDFGADTTPPSVTLAAPNGGQKVFTGSSYEIQWTASNDTGLSFDISVSGDGGGTFAPIAGCQNLPGWSRSCLWLAPGPPSGNAMVRVEVEDPSGNSSSDDSDSVFRIVSGTAAVTVVSPNTNVRWRIGSLHPIQWAHNLGLNSSFRIELDRDDDGTYEELLASAAPASSPAKGSFDWRVSRPVSLTARMRVSWNGNPAVTDSSDVTFQIRPNELAVKERSASCPAPAR